MSERKCNYSGPNHLLVEGQDDQHVIWALCEYFKLPECFDIINCGGDEEVLDHLEARIPYPQGNEIIGVVIDADEGYEKDPDQAFNRRWEQVRNKIQKKGYMVPETIDPKGVIIEAKDDKPKIGIWLMPNNKEPGMLEDFIKKLAPEEKIEYSRKVVEQAKTDNMTSFKPTHKTKAEVHTYLAWQDKPGNPMGLAITAKALCPETEIATQFVGWLKKLFEIQE